MLLEVFLVLAALLYLVYYYITKDGDYWQKQGVPHLKLSFPFGSEGFRQVILRKEHMYDYLKRLSKQFKNEKVFGLFMFGKPVLVVQDPDITRDICVKDFANFTERRSQETQNKILVGETDKLWKRQLTNLNGNEWKEVRSTFSPIFTSGKLRSMMHFLQHVAKNMAKELDKHAGRDTELKPVFGKFSMDSIASCAFGVDAESFAADKDSAFVRNAEAVFSSSGVEALVRLLLLVPGVSQVFRLFGINVLKPKETRFFYNTVKETLRSRMQSGVRRNDMVDLMTDLIKSGPEEDLPAPADQFEADSKIDYKRGGGRRHQLDEEILVATAMVFLVAGYDTTASTLSCAVYEISRNNEVQRRLQDEVDEAYEQAGGGAPDYTVVQDLAYLDQVIQETLRLHPPLGATTRSVEAGYSVKETNATLRPKDIVFINAVGMHSNPEYFPNPEEFNPDNFSKEAKANRSPYCFLAFGQGPRNCIGMRFAILELKIALVTIVHRFNLLPSDKNQLPILHKPDAGLAFPIGGLWARIERR